MSCGCCSVTESGGGRNFAEGRGTSTGSLGSEGWTRGLKAAAGGLVARSRLNGGLGRAGGGRHVADG